MNHWIWTLLSLVMLTQGCGKDTAPDLGGWSPTPGTEMASSQWRLWAKELNQQDDWKAQLATLVMQLKTRERINQAATQTSMKVECTQYMNVRCEFNWEK